MKTYNYIYLITNTLDGKIYIGKHSSNKLNDKYFGSGLHIKRAIKKYGKENFIKEILAYTDNQESLNWMERYYIKKYKAQDQEIGYNISPGGDGGCVYGEKHPMLGKHLSDEHKRKISDSEKGRYVKHSEETKRKIGEALKGKKRKPFSEETRLKMSINGKGKHNHKGENNPNWKGGIKNKSN